MTEKQQQQQENYDETSPQSAELFYLIVENIKDYAIFMTDPAGTVVSWNPGVERLLGYTESEIVRQPISIIFSPEDRAAGAHIEEMETAAAKGRSEDKRWHQRKDGSRFWANGMVMPLKNADGSLRGFAKVMRDDTAQKLSEEKIRQANSYTENILSSIADAFYTFDSDLRYVYVNKATTEMFGLSEVEFLGKTLWDLFPDVAGNIFHHEIKLTLEQQQPRVFENYYPPLDRWFENRIYPSPDGLSVFTTEITARKRAETALQQSEEKYRTLFDSIDEGFCIIEMLYDDTGKPVDWLFLESNPAFGKNNSIENVDGKRITEMAPNIEPKWFEIYGRVVETGEPIRVSEGSEALNTWFDVYAFRIGAPEERKVAVLFTDITARKQAEEAMRQSEEKYRNLANAMPQLVWTAQQDGTVDYYNELAENYDGIRFNQETKTWSWEPIVHPDELEATTTAWQAAQKTGRYEFEHRIKMKTGEYCWHLSRALAIRDEDGAIVRWFGTATDIDERKRAEAEREELLESEQNARREAEQANQLKDEFLATLSHELRTPLNAILGWSQVLQNRNLDEENARKALTTIERSARAQNQLIEDILDVSRIITGKLRLDVRAVDLPSVIGAAVDAARPAAEAKNIRLQTLLDPSAGPISGDPDRLQQVVWNLLSNAIKFTDKNGRVQVRLERINSHVEITVSDTGKGIEAEFLPHVFDRFRQSDGSMSRRHGGLGLGLAIVRQLIELHGGTVSVDSAGSGQGATFTVNLPLLPVRRELASDVPRIHPQAATGASADCPPELDELRVLLVDDEADSRDLLNLVLDSCGAEVETASSAAEALAIIERERFDVIISDIGMPEEDGFSLIGKIRNLPNEKGGDTPAIALTAYARAEDRVQALRSGFQMHIAKPVEPVELVAVVANLAGRIRKPNRNENE